MNHSFDLRIQLGTFIPQPSTRNPSLFFWMNMKMVSCETAAKRCRLLQSKWIKYWILCLGRNALFAPTRVTGQAKTVPYDGQRKAKWKWRQRADVRHTPAGTAEQSRAIPLPSPGARAIVRSLMHLHCPLCKQKGTILPHFTACYGFPLPLFSLLEQEP